MAAFCYNLGKLIKKNTYGFYLYHGNCLGEMKCNLLFFHINFNRKNTKAQILFLLTQWLLIPVRFIFPEIKLEERRIFGLNFKYRSDSPFCDTCLCTTVTKQAGKNLDWLNLLVSQTSWFGFDVQLNCQV